MQLAIDINSNKTIRSTSKYYQYKEEKSDSVLSFKKTSSTEVEKAINNLSIVKACQKDDIPTKVIKMNKDIFPHFKAKDFNKCFKESFYCIFNKHAPIKRRYIRANEAPFMTKELHKAIMKRSRLRKKFLKTKSITDRKNYNVQRNYCKKLSRYLLQNHTLIT